MSFGRRNAPTCPYCDRTIHPSRYQIHVKQCPERPTEISFPFILAPPPMAMLFHDHTLHAVTTNDCQYLQHNEKPPQYTQPKTLKTEQKKSHDPRWKVLRPHKTPWIAHQLILINSSIWYSTDYDKGERGMVEYNCNTNQIQQIIQYPHSIKPVSHSCCAKGNNIYIIDGKNGEIISFNITNTTFTKQRNIFKMGGATSCILINNDIHIIGGEKSSKHCIYSIANNKIKSVNDASSRTKIMSVCVLKYKELCIKFGGFGVNASKIADTFYVSSVGSVENFKWRLQSKYKLRNGICNCGYILYRQYIITFGGQLGAGEFTDKIYVLDLKSNVGWFELGHIECPLKGNYKAILDGDGRVHLFCNANEWPNWEDSVIKHYAIPIKTVLGPIVADDGKDDEKEEEKCSECQLVKAQNRSLEKLVNELLQNQNEMAEKQEEYKKEIKVLKDEVKEHKLQQELKLDMNLVDGHGDDEETKIDATEAKLAKLKKLIKDNRNTVVNGCGDMRCTNPMCKSNAANRDKVYSDQEASKLALKMVKSKHKSCEEYKNEREPPPPTPKTRLVFQLLENQNSLMDKQQEYESSCIQYQQRIKALTDEIDEYKVRQSVLEEEKAVWLRKEQQYKMEKEQMSQQLLAKQDETTEIRNRLENELIIETTTLQQQLMKAQNETKEAEKKLGQSEEECKQLQLEVAKVKDELDGLKKKRPDTSKYYNWSADEFVDWIISIRNGQFRKYEDELRKTFAIESVNGSTASLIDKAELRNWGINSLLDRTHLYQCIQDLIHQNKPQPGNDNNDTYDEGAEGTYI